MSTYYDGNKLLNLRDVNGNKPEIYIVCGNRSSGKTTYFNRLLVNRFKNKGEKFILLYRFKYEIKDAETKFFSDIGRLFFPDDEMKGKYAGAKSMKELTLNGDVCGYAISLNAADMIKKYSHLLSDCKAILFDEFMAETGQYAENEIHKFMSIHSSAARGNGEQSRYLPVYMLSNTVSKVNPYFMALGINKQLNSDAKFIRGNGFVLEMNHNKSSEAALKESTFNKALSTNRYLEYAAAGEFMDNEALIAELEGDSDYICTVYDSNNLHFSIRLKDDIYYCVSSIDQTAPLKITTMKENVGEDKIYLPRTHEFILKLYTAYILSKVRYEDLLCKNGFMELIFKY